MFRGLTETIRSLNADLNNVTNCKRAKKLRRTLLSFGLPLVLFAFAGAIFCLVMFIKGGYENLKEMNGEFANFKIQEVVIPFIALIPLIIFGMIGLTLTRLGFQIIITGYASKLIDDAVNNNCPFCGDKIVDKEKFCSNCGKQLYKQCPKCKHNNHVKSNFCDRCGEKL